MTSMSYQTALMKVRYIYRWDEPQTTAIYCSAYFLLLVIGQLGSGIVRTESSPLIRGQNIMLWEH